jgi:hypothetical protein
LASFALRVRRFARRGASSIRDRSAVGSLSRRGEFVNVSSITRAALQPVGDKNARERESLEIKGFARGRKGFITQLNELEFRAQSFAERTAPHVP